MRITSFHIDGFGIYNNVDVTELAPGLSIFYGENEAGKSTCLEFLRAMLTGYPRSRRDTASRFEPVYGGVAGGSVEIEYSTAKGASERLRIIRRPGGANALSLVRPDGTAVAAPELERIFNGVTQDVYRTVFGFSLGELERFESLSEEGVRNALYGASFGIGLVSPAEALKNLDARMGKIFKPTGVKPPLNAVLLELDEVAERIAACQEQAVSYDEQSRHLARKEAELARIRDNRRQLESERRALEQRLALWQQWDEWRQARDQLEELPAEQDDFPEDANARFARADENLQACVQQVAAQEKKVAAQQARLESLTPDALLLQELPLLQRIAERKSTYLQAVSRFAACQENLERSQADLQRNLALLGPDWTCDRIRQTDRSLFAREGLEKNARSLTSASLAEEAATTYLQTANRELEAADRAMSEAQASLEAMPEPVPELAVPEQEELARELERLRECKRLAPRRKEAFASALASFSRAVKQLNVASEDTLEQLSGEEPDETSMTAASSMVDGLLATRAKALSQAEEIQGLIEQAKTLDSQHGQLERDLAQLRKNIEDKTEEQRKNGGATRQALETRSKSLKELRATVAQLESVENRLADLEQQIAENPAPRRRRNFPLLCLASLFIFAGCFLFFGARFLDLHEFVIMPDFSLPVSLPYSYGCLALGVLLIAIAWPGNSDELRRYQAFALQTGSARQAALDRLEGLTAEVEKKCAEVGIESPDNYTLDATEVRLERDKERCINDERSQREIEALKAAMAEKQEAQAALQLERQSLESAIQQARRRWHSLMESVNLQIIPLPESSAHLFAQLNNAATAWENLARVKQEGEAYTAEQAALEESIAGLPPVAQRLESSSESGLEGAARDTLDACRKAEEDRAAYARAQLDLESARKEFLRARERQQAAAASLQEATAIREGLSASWHKSLEDLGLEENLEPETVRQSFSVMADCLNVEEKMQAAEKELASCEDEQSAFQEQLASVLHRLGHTAAPDLQPMDWVRKLDELLAEGNLQAGIQNEAARLAVLVRDEEDQLNAHKAALLAAEQRIGSLFAQALATDAEEFLRKAHEQAQVRHLKERLKELEYKLGASRGELTLQEFLESFSAGDRPSQESRLASINRQLDDLGRQEQETATEVYEGATRIRSISTDSEMPRLRQRQASLQEEADRLARQWAISAMAREILLKARHKFESERQPEVIRLASDIFRNLTNGKWQGLRTTLDDSRLEILRSHGEPVSPGTLSRGAQEQAYLALRLAYIRNHAEHSTSLPVIMDEILVNFDPARAERAAREFARLAESDSEGQQIFYFTCQPHIVEMLRNTAPLSKIFNVRDNSILPA